MNVADSQRVASALERLGYSGTPVAEEADVILAGREVHQVALQDAARHVVLDRFLGLGHRLLNRGPDALEDRLYLGRITGDVGVDVRG